MRHCRGLLAPALLLLTCVAHARADTYPRQPGVDAIHYTFRLQVGDDSNEIAGDATVTLRVAAPGLDHVFLDLASATGGRGMIVSDVLVDGRPAGHAHRDDRLRITLAAPPPGADVAVTVRYRGVPAAGLRLIDNIYGERTMFSENWPNRARQWLPMIDHPYDKATGEFIVTAPSQYQVVANGLLVEEVDVPGGRRRTHWRQNVPIASWLYAIGVARFAVHHYDVARGIPQQVWVFPQDRERAYALFEPTGRRAFEFFSEMIGPYPYEKLAHVQAAGIGGGTEHATAIFYGEKGVAAGRAPVVHEVAHQWWGDAVTENDWDDVWLSEGFATYFTHLYAEQFSGRDAFVSGLRNDIRTIVQAQQQLPDQPVIHRNLADMGRVLNRLVYQKGGWVLHMLRGLIGTDRFRAGIRAYYGRYRNANASTDDFRQVMEQAGGVDLRWFFDQWLRRPGLPRLSATWHWDAKAQRLRIDVAQTQPGEPFRLPLDIGVAVEGGARTVHRVELGAARSTYEVAAPQEPSAVILDPDTWLLAETLDVSRAAAPARRRDPLPLDEEAGGLCGTVSATGSSVSPDMTQPAGPLIHAKSAMTHDASESIRRLLRHLGSADRVGRISRRSHNPLTRP